MRVTIVIPLFNTEQYVADAIDSVLWQTRPVHEVIVVDDESTDAGPAVVARYAAPVRVEHQPHRGSGAARNRGARLATGELLVFLDADDRLAPDALERHLTILETRPEIDGTFGEIAEFVDDGAVLTGPAMRRPRTTGPVRLVSTMVLRRVAFESVGLFDEELHRSEGIDWITRADDCGIELAPAPGAVLHRRLHGSNNGLREIEHLGEYARTLKRVIDRRRAAP